MQVGVKKPCKYAVFLWLHERIGFWILGYGCCIDSNGGRCRINVQKVHDKLTFTAAPMSQKPKTKTQNTKPKSKSNVRSVDERRTEKLQAIKLKLEQGKHVQNRDLETWLPRDAYESIAGLWDYEKERRSAMYGEKPSEVKEYEERLAKAIFTFNKSEYFSTRGTHPTAKRLSDKSESEFESALEWLVESYQLNPSIRSWFDRDIDVSECTLDPDGMPRVITSRSLVRQKGIATQTIADIKLRVVRDALFDLTAPPVDKEARQKASDKLKKLLDMSKLDDFDI